MIHVPAVAVAAVQWLDAASALRKELGREPEANEVRAKLGWPEIVGVVEIPAAYLEMAPGGTSAAVPGSRFRVRVEKADEKLKITLMETRLAAEEKV